MVSILRCTLRRFFSELAFVRIFNFPNDFPFRQRFLAFVLVNSFLLSPSSNSLLVLLRGMEYQTLPRSLAFLPEPSCISSQSALSSPVSSSVLDPVLRNILYNDSRSPVRRILFSWQRVFINTPSVIVLKRATPTRLLNAVCGVVSWAIASWHFLMRLRFSRHSLCKEVDWFLLTVSRQVGSLCLLALVPTLRQVSLETTLL